MRLREIVMLFAAAIVLLACKDSPVYQQENIQKEVDSTSASEAQAKTVNAELMALLDTPVQLSKFKASKRFFTTSVVNGRDYLFNPGHRDSIFYAYYYPKRSDGPLSINTFLVFKYGQYKHTYEDSTEVFVALKIVHKDTALGKADLVGKSYSQIQNAFGEAQFNFRDRLNYAHKNKLLSIALQDSVVAHYLYMKLNTKQIDSVLIEKILQREYRQ